MYRASETFGRSGWGETFKGTGNVGPSQTLVNAQVFEKYRVWLRTDPHPQNGSPVTFINAWSTAKGFTRKLSSPPKDPNAQVHRKGSGVGFEGHVHTIDLSCSETKVKGFTADVKECA